MLTETLKQLIVMVALVGMLGAESPGLTAAPAGPSRSRAVAGSASVDQQASRRRRLPAPPVEDGCRELPAPAATPPPPATCW
jgi:hypothetical protein